LIDAVFLESAIEEGDGGLYDDLIREAIGSVDAVAMKGGLDSAWVCDLLAASVEIIANAEGVIYGEAEAGVIVFSESANWRGGEFSTISAEGLMKQEGRENGSDAL